MFHEDITKIIEFKISDMFINKIFNCHRSFDYVTIVVHITKGGKYAKFRYNFVILLSIFLIASVSKLLQTVLIRKVLKFFFDYVYD